MMRIHRRVGPVAHGAVKRVPEGTQGTPTFDSSGQAVNTNASRTGDYAKNTVASSTPPSTIALAVLLAIAVVAFISGCVYWRIRRRRTQRSGGAQTYSSSPHSTLFGIESRPESVESESSSFGGRSVKVQKPGNAFVINHPFRNEETGWVPQIRNYRGVPLVNGELPRHVQAAREGKRWLKSLSQVGMSEKPAETTPPPTYAIVSGHRPSKSADARPSGPPPGIPLPPTPPETIVVRPPTPPMPPVKGKKPKLSPPPLSKPTELPTVPSSRFSLSPLPKTPGSSADPLPSPARINSFVHQQGEIPAEIKLGTSKDGLPLPRLMSVINTFTPSLEDEMLIHIGDTIRMLEEYTDGWCLVQRIGKSDAPRGVVPRFCLVERQSTQTTRRNIIKSIQASAKRI
ncbi:hypothetical protein L218DRAFT_996666 [Marasmius fiardii PR-910]|nr:hypothetical protein L218DRAFT_996666 [Marasmius fiardii PR-910]